ncbi:MAG: murein biosynthesis integral membrane protein MurJ [Hyphomicrobiales bacterium]|nr:murein biosynthesis integral membrane protein MurJ [Hyphomicrobiales bacterium]
MIRNLLSVGGLTLLSRITGFARDVLMGAALGGGAMADAFTVAFRLPNHFRAIFGEGAFNAAFVPSFTRTLAQDGRQEARLFSGRVYILLFLSQIVLLALALVFMPQMVDLLAPGFRQDPAKFDLAVSLTRITFPYLMLITLVTLQSGSLNAEGRFMTAAFAPVLLNLSMIAALAVSFLFPNAAYAAAWGVVISGVLQFLLVEIAAWRADIGPLPARPQWDGHISDFFKALAPAVLGSAGVQIAIFADTIIGSYLPTGGPASIYYADRIYQLPIGVIGIAAGTVLLPEMSRAFAKGDDEGAARAQNRTMALTIALSAPFFVAFMLIPDLIMRAAFLRGAFTAQNAAASADVLQAYSVGLLAVVLIASARASFQARGDTQTPMIVSLAAVAINVAIKLALYKSFGAPGLALATAIGAWINFGSLVFLAWRAGYMKPSDMLGRMIAATACGATALGLAIAPVEPLVRKLPPLAQLAILGAIGAAAYIGGFFAGGKIVGLDLSILRNAITKRKSRARGERA